MPMDGGRWSCMWGTDPRDGCQCLTTSHYPRRQGHGTRLCLVVQMVGMPTPRSQNYNETRKHRTPRSRKTFWLQAFPPTGLGAERRSLVTELDAHSPWICTFKQLDAKDHEIPGILNCGAFIFWFNSYLDLPVRHVESCPLPVVVLLVIIVSSLFFGAGPRSC